jgi:hypothetical protein
MALQGQAGGGLGAVEQDQAAEPLVRGDVLGVHPVAADEVHQRQGVLGVVQRLVVALQRQPGDAAVVELDELAVGLGAVLGRHEPGRGLAPRGLPAPRRAMAEVIQVGREPMGPDAVGAALDLQLQHAQLDPDLQHRPAVPRPHLARDELVGLGLVRPTLQRLVDVSPHRRLPPRRDQGFGAARFIRRAEGRGQMPEGR